MVLRKKEYVQTDEWQNRKSDIEALEKRFRNILIATILGIGIMALLGYYLMTRYTSTIMDVYASQQDNYVQLVLDQINLQDDRTEETIISDIIDTLDSGNTRYWTLAKEDNILFIKNVTETDKYQGISMDELYDSNSADDFVEGLRLNRVTHEIITMDQVQYVASGVIFEYNEMQYRLCLLTDETVILDNNEFLSTQIGMYIYVIVLMMLMLIVAMIAESFIKKREVDNNLLKGRLEIQNQHIERLELESKERDAYDARLNIYKSHYIRQFAEKLDEKSVKKAVFVVLEFEQAAAMKNFLVHAMGSLDENALRFWLDDRRMILLMCHCSHEQAWNILKRENVTEQISYMDDVEESKRSIVEACEIIKDKEW